MAKSVRNYRGLLVIGDPHIEGRNPGFRKGNYPEAILGKVRWCLEHARKHKLLPAFLGDVFDKPRDNPTWVIGELIEMLMPYPAIGIYGNHDCADPQLSENDSLSILIKAGCYQLVGEQDFWTGMVEGRRVVVAGSSYRQRIPQCFDTDNVPRDSLFDAKPTVVWLTHHDIDIGNYENGKFGPFEMMNVDLLINGHIHRPAKPVRRGDTTWMSPGNISRRSRSAHSRAHVPTVTEVTFPESGFEVKSVVVPHERFEDVFFLDDVDESKTSEPLSSFVSGLSELTKRRTSSGAGLIQFLDQNLDEYSDSVAAEIRSLAKQVVEK
ncbi:metallophosphoesterase [Mariniblastus fucicola]|uniref:Calcineurin-like phosphoesterase superfamily domain protein n=1 Tax=Mariniblastus fucicola TaxID=980251 RepID=A0A5B9P2L0_9BACT|nr:metallophosphoesterase [Mariniblastus fucicola]QEG20757.1 Calcineurin-like phosphoesterase superfamily domain protein [Mariniblastus fucicola]